MRAYLKLLRFFLSSKYMFLHVFCVCKVFTCAFTCDMGSKTRILIACDWVNKLGIKSRREA